MSNKRPRAEYIEARARHWRPIVDAINQGERGEYRKQRRQDALDEIKTAKEEADKTPSGKYKEVGDRYTEAERKE